MAAGGEIKNVLTLDVSKFTSALDRATSDLNKLDGQLKGVSKAVETLEKSTSTLGSNITTTAEKFRLLDQTIGNLAAKLGAAAASGFDTVSSKARRASKDIEDFDKTTSKSGSTLLSMSEWTKRYGVALESIKPSLQSVTKSQNDLTKAQKETANAANLSAAEQIKARIKTLESEKETNAKIIAEKQKLAAELAAIENKIRNESLAHKVAADKIEARIGPYGGKNKIAAEMVEATRLDNNANFIKRQRQETLRLIEALREKNNTIVGSLSAEQKAYAQEVALEQERRQMALRAIEEARKEARQKAEAEKEAARIKRQEEKMWRDYEREQRRIATEEARAAQRQARKEAKAAAQAAREAEKQASEEKKAIARAELEEKRQIERQKRDAAKKAAREEAEFNKWIKEEQKKWDREQARVARETAAERKRLEREVAQAAVAAAREQAAAARQAAEERKRAAREAAAIEKQQAQEVIRMWKGMGQLWAASKIQAGLMQTVEQSSSLQQANLRVSILGLSAEEMEEFNRKAYDLARQEKYLSNIDAINARYTALTSLGANKVNLIDATLPAAMQTVQALRLLGFENGNATDVQRNLYGVAEMRQVVYDAEATKRTFDTVFRAAKASGGKINVADLETILRNIGPSASQLSDKGILNLLALAEQMKVAGGAGTGSAGTGVSTVGTMVKMMQLYAAGKPMKIEAIEQFMGAGLMNTDAFKNGDTGFGKRERDALSQVSWKIARSAGFKDIESLMADPMTYMKNIREPLLQFMLRNKDVYFDKGADLNSVEAQNAAFTKFFARSGYSHRAVSMMVMGMDPRFIDRMEKNTKLAQQGDGAAETINKAKEGWIQATTEMKAAASNLASAFEPILEPLGKMLGVIADITNAVANFAKNNPLTAQFALTTVAAGGLVLAIKGVIGTFGAITGISSLLKTLAGNMGATGAAARGMGSAMGSAAANSGLVYDSLMNVWRGSNAVASTVPTMGQRVASVFSSMLGWVKTVALRFTGLGAAFLAGWHVGELIAKLKVGDIAIGTWAASLMDMVATKFKNGWLHIQDLWASESQKLRNAEERAENDRQMRGARRANGIGLSRDEKIAQGFISPEEMTAPERFRWEQEQDYKRSEVWRREQAAKKAKEDEERKAKEQAAEIERQAQEATNNIRLGFGGVGKQYRQFENAFARQFYSAETRAAIEQLKLDGMMNGSSAFMDQARQEVIKMWMGGDLDDGKDPSKRKFLKDGVYGKDGRVTVGGKGYDPLKPWGVDQMDWDAKFAVGTDAEGNVIKKSLNDLQALIAERKALIEAIKAQTFATERAAAADVEANNAAERLADGGIAKKTDGMRALEREFEREEKRTGVLNRNANGDYANPEQAQNYLLKKRQALAEQSRADLANYATDTIEKTRELNAELLTTERERLIASQNAVLQAEDAKWRAVKETFDKELAALDAGTKKHAEMLAVKEAAERRHGDYMEALQKKMARDRMTPLERMIEEWKDVYKQISDLEANWANSFIDTLHQATTTGRADLRSFVLGVANDLSKMMLRKTFGEAIKGMFGQAGGFLKQLIGGAAQGGNSAAATVGQAATGAAANAAGQIAATNAVTTAMQGLSQTSALTNAAMMQMVTQGLSSSTQSLIQNVVQSGVTLTAEQSATLGLMMMTKAAWSAAAALMTIQATQGATSGVGLFGGLLAAAKGGAFDGSYANFADVSFFAKGGSFTNSVVDAPTLFKFANGGKFGVMGEAGPEAIMPLKRGPDGSLGVQVYGAQADQGASAGQTVNISIVVNNPNNPGSDNQQSSGQANDMDVWNRMATKVKAVVREELVTQQRPGGVLYK